MHMRYPSHIGIQQHCNIKFEISDEEEKLVKILKGEELNTPNIKYYSQDLINKTISFKFDSDSYCYSDTFVTQLTKFKMHIPINGGRKTFKIIEVISATITTHMDSSECCVEFRYEEIK